MSALFVQDRVESHPLLIEAVSCEIIDKLIKVDKLLMSHDGMICMAFHGCISVFYLPFKLGQ